MTNSKNMLLNSTIGEKCSVLIYRYGNMVIMASANLSILQLRCYIIEIDFFVNSDAILDFKLIAKHCRLFLAISSF